MSGKLLDSEQAQTIAVNYVCQKENVPSSYIKIESFWPYSWSGLPAFLFRGKINKQTINPENWQAGVLEEHLFSICITADEGKTVGYRPGEWVKSQEQQSDNSDNQIDRELKQSQIERNRAETERNNAEMQRLADEEFEREMQKQHPDLGKKYGIDPNRFKL